MLKKQICLILAVLTIISTLSVGSVSFAADSTLTNLEAIVKKFPNGKYWNNVGKSKNDPDGVTSTPCRSHSNCSWNKSCDCNNFDNAIQCMGYAHKIAYEITGVKPRNNYTKSTTLKASSLRVGDVIRYRWNGHSLCVTGVKGTKISFTDCNWVGKCQIRWGVMDISDIMGFSYVLHLSGNNRKNTDLYFYQGKSSNSTAGVSGNNNNTAVDIAKNDPHEDWKMVDANLNVRAEHTTDSNVVGSISDGTKFKVYDKYDDGKYLWGKILFGSTVGWCALNYSEYLGGTIETPDIKSTDTICYVGEKIKISWSEVCGSEKYLLYIYDEYGDVYDKFSIRDKTSQWVLIDCEGGYTARVYAANSLTPDWKIACAKDFSFTAVEKENLILVESIKLNAPTKLAKGDSVTIDAVVKPANATDDSLVWKSSDTTVASVNSKGKVTGKKFGTAKITCTAADSGEVKKSVTITVVPEQVTALKQNYSTTGKLGLSWKKVSSADFYCIYRYDTETNTYKRVATTTNTQYKFKLTAGRSYKFKVYAVKKGDKDSYFSEPACIIGVSGPKAAELSARYIGTVARLSWKKVSGATHYIIYRVSGDELIKLGTVDADTLSYTIEGLRIGTTYQFKVRSIRKDSGVTGYGCYSNAVKIY